MRSATQYDSTVAKYSELSLLPATPAAQTLRFGRTNFQLELPVCLTAEDEHPAVREGKAPAATACGVEGRQREPGAAGNVAAVPIAPPCAKHKSVKINGPQSRAHEETC